MKYQVQTTAEPGESHYKNGSWVESARCPDVFSNREDAVEAAASALRFVGQFRSSGYRVVQVPDPVPSPKPVVYVAHPVSGQCLVNVYKTVAWIRYLVEADPTRIYHAPWLAQVMAFPDTEGGQNYLPFERCLADDKESLARCDEIILVGGRRSPGMQVELDEAKRLKLRITDMSRYATPSDLPDGFHLDPHAA